MSDYRVYVLQNAGGKFYIGLSEDPQRRLEQHNAGESKWTQFGRPWRIVWLSETRSLSQVRKLEDPLKRQKGGGGFFRLTGLNRVSGSIIPRVRDRGFKFRPPTNRDRGCV